MVPGEEASWRRYLLVLAVVLSAFLWWLGPAIGLFLVDPLIQLTVSSIQAGGGRLGGPAACATARRAAQCGGARPAGVQCAAAPVCCGSAAQLLTACPPPPGILPLRSSTPRPTATTTRSPSRCPLAAATAATAVSMLARRWAPRPAAAEHNVLHGPLAARRHAHAACACLRPWPPLARPCRQVCEDAGIVNSYWLFEITNPEEVGRCQAAQRGLAGAPGPAPQGLAGRGGGQA